MSGGYFNKLNLSRSVELRKLGDDAARLAELSTTGLLARDFAVSATLFGVLSAASYYSIDALVSPSHQSTALAVSLASIGSLCLYNLVCGQSTTIPAQTAVTDTLLSVPAEDCAGKSGSAEDDDLPIEARPRRSAFFKDTLSGIDGAQTAKDVINAMKPSESNPDADCMLFRKPIASRLARPRKPASGSGGAASSSSGGGASGKKLSIEKVVSHFENEASVWPRSKVLAALDVIGEQLRGAGLETGDRVNVFASTSHQWMLTAMACWNAGFTVVTSYASLGPDALAHTVHEARCSAIVCDRSLLPIVSQLSREHLRSVTHLFTIPDHASLCEELEVDSKEAEGELAGKDVKVGPLRYDPGESPAGYPKPITPAAISPSQPAMIMYTSGTTGKPKGVQLLHRTIAGIVHGFKEALPALDSSDVYHGYLPLAHIFEVAAELAMLGTGVPIAYGSPFTLTGTSPAIDKKPMARKGGAQAATEGDLLVYRPTFMAGVPRIFNKIRNGIEAKVAASPVAKVLFGAGLSVKLANIEKYGLAGCRHGFWDKLVFDGVRKKVTGGRLRVLIGGAGPTSPSAQRWLQAVFCCTMQQGYGLTETSAGGTVSMMYEYNTGTVGPPIGSARVWLRAHKDHPDKKPAGDPATRSPPTGEIWLSGSNVSPGYLAVGEQKDKMDRLNREVFQQRWGRTWFNTGDIGQWTPDGILRITGRTKALIKLSNGEYVNRGIVESELGACKTTAFLAVHVDPDHDYCVAVAVPDPAYFKASMGDERYAAALRDADCDAADCKPGDAMAALAKVEAVRREIKEEVQQVGRQSAKQARMGRAEVPGDVLVVGDDWLEKGVELVTDSQKNKHKVIYDRYAEELEAVYAGGAGGK